MADVTAVDAPMNIRESRAAAHAAAGREGVDLTRSARITDADSPEGRIVTRAAERLRENDWRKALETLGKSEPVDTHWGGWQDTVPGQVFTDVDPVNGERIARNAAETTRLTDITATMEAYDILLENGYGGLTGTEKTTVDGIIDRTILGNTQLTELYTNNATPPVIDRARIAGLMNEPAMKKYLATALNEAYDPTKRFNMIDVQKAVEAYTKANNELTTLTADRAAANTAAGITDALWDAQVVGGMDRATRMNDIRTRLSTPTFPAGHDGLNATALAQRGRDIQSFQRNLEERNALMARRTVDHAAIQRLNDRLDNARRDTKYGTDLVAYQNLYEARLENAAKRSEAEKKRTELDGKIAEKTAEVNVKRSEQADKLREARANSTKFEQSINRALGRAVSNTIGEKVGVFMDQYRPAEKEVLDIAKQENAAIISDELQRRLTKTTRRWVNYLPGTGWLGNSKREVLNKRQIQKDARVLLSQGPQGLVRQILESSSVPRAEQELLLRDPSFMQQQGKEIYGKVLAGYMMTGGKIAPSQYEAMSMSDWGPEVLNEMISKNKEARAMVEKHTGQPYTEQSVRQLLADPNNQKWLRRALLTAGGIGLFYAGPAGIAAGVSAVGGALNYVAGDAALQWVDAAKDVGTAIAGHTGEVIGKGIDVVAGGAGAVGKGVVDNVAAIGANSTALQEAGNAISGAMTSADAALRAGDVGAAVGEGAKEVVDRVTTTADVVSKNVAAAKAAYIKP